jgi:hypothetical protein
MGYPDRISIVRFYCQEKKKIMKRKKIDLNIEKGVCKMQSKRTSSLVCHWQMERAVEHSPPPSLLPRPPPISMQPSFIQEVTPIGIHAQMVARKSFAGNFGVLNLIEKCNFTTRSIMGYAYTRARARTFVDITCRGV